MSVDATMAVLYAQTNLAAPFANAAAVAPQASMAMSRVLAAEMARQEQQQIEKTEKTEDSAVLPDGRNGGNAYFGSRRRTRQPLSEASPQDEDVRASASPLVGNLLNLKV